MTKILFDVVRDGQQRFGPAYEPILSLSEGAEGNQWAAPPTPQSSLPDQIPFLES